MSGIAVLGEPKVSIVDYVRGAFSSLYSSICSLVGESSQRSRPDVRTFNHFDEAAAERNIAKVCQEARTKYGIDLALYRAGRSEKAPEPVDSLDVDLKDGDPSRIFAPFGLEFIADSSGPAPLCETYVGPRSEISKIERIIQERLLEYGGRAIIGKGSTVPDALGVTRNQLWPPLHHYVFPTKEDKPKSESS